MEKITIDHKKHFLYPVWSKLYATAFPVFEQRTGEQQEYAFSCSQYRLTAYTDNGQFIGFIAYWIFDTYIYIEHFAVDTVLRGKGYGSRILNDFVVGNPKTVLLEIDPVVDEVSAARLRFYRRCGFYENEFPHIHPPYRIGCSGHSLVVLSGGRKISGEEYDRFAEDLKVQVMGIPK